jgi:hypothetical protein
MTRETCKQCETDFMDNQSQWSIEDMLEWKLNDHPEFWDMCIKCFVIIINRYI